MKHIVLESEHVITAVRQSRRLNIAYCKDNQSKTPTANVRHVVYRSDRLMNVPDILYHTPGR